MLGQFTGEQKAHGSLDLPTGDGGTLVVVGQSRSLGGDSLEDIVHEAVHDRHGLARDAGVGVNLLEDLVDVNAVAFLPPPVPLLSPTWPRSLSGLLGTLLRDLSGWSHSDRRLDVYAMLKRQRDNDMHTAEPLPYLYSRGGSARPLSDRSSVIGQAARQLPIC